MSTLENISLFVPHVFPNFDETYVANIFNLYGVVDHVDFVAKQDRNGKPFNSAYIHFKFWYDNTESRMLHRHILDGKAESRVYHDGPWYWIVLENKGKKHISGDRKPRIDLGDNAKSISLAFTTPVKQVPEKPVLKRGEKIDGTFHAPGAPIKSYAQAVDPAYKLTTGWTDAQRQLIAEFDAISSIRALDDLCAIEAPLSIGPNDYAKSFIDPMEDAALDKEAKEMLAQMEEIDAELEAEDANLVSIDGRYVNELEVENLYLRNEVAQLRASLLNMDYLYQTEAAKVRALSVQFVNVIPGDENV